MATPGWRSRHTTPDRARSANTTASPLTGKPKLIFGACCKNIRNGAGPKQVSSSLHLTGKWLRFSFLWSALAKERPVSRQAAKDAKKPKPMWGSPVCFCVFTRIREIGLGHAFLRHGRGTGLATFSRALKNGFVFRFERKPVQGFLGVLCGFARYRSCFGAAWIS